MEGEMGHGYRVAGKQKMEAEMRHGYRVSASGKQRMVGERGTRMTRIWRIKEHKI